MTQTWLPAYSHARPNNKRAYQRRGRTCITLSPHELHCSECKAVQKLSILYSPISRKKIFVSLSLSKHQPPSEEFRYCVPIDQKLVWKGNTKGLLILVEREAACSIREVSRNSWQVWLRTWLYTVPKSTQVQMGHEYLFPKNTIPGSFTQLHRPQKKLCCSLLVADHFNLVSSYSLQELHTLEVGNFQALFWTDWRQGFAWLVLENFRELFFLQSEAKLRRVHRNTKQVVKATGAADVSQRDKSERQQTV